VDTSNNKFEILVLYSNEFYPKPDEPIYFSNCTV
jgi:hypothetical protein